MYPCGPLYVLCKPEVNNYDVQVKGLQMQEISGLLSRNLASVTVLGKPNNYYTHYGNLHSLSSLKQPSYAHSSGPELAVRMASRFPNRPLIIRVPFFLLISFNKETPKYKGKKGTIGVPRLTAREGASASCAPAPPTRGRANCLPAESPD